MARIEFTTNIQRHVECPVEILLASTLDELLTAYFARHPRARSYVLDDQGALRHHMVIFVDGSMIDDRVHFSEALMAESEVHVFQALSGG
ncbi:MAG: MoaD/ThiS family protein [Planctomycetota bacterium]